MKKLVLFFAAAMFAVAFAACGQKAANNDQEGQEAPEVIEQEAPAAPEVEGEELPIENVEEELPVE